MALPSGFRFSGVGCGIKDSGAPDLSLIVADDDCVAAGVYTQNVVRAASIDWNRQLTPTEQFRGLVINSGNANACTGDQGVEDNRQMAETLATEIGASPEQVLVLSTGIIGHALPMANVKEGIKRAATELGHSDSTFDLAANGILTTDKSTKTFQSSAQINQTQIKFAGMAKGAGMIGPNMATLLAVIMTDAKLDARTAGDSLKRVADLSFNRISVEGHTSTNDAMLLLASGAAGNEPMSGDVLQCFETELANQCVALAKMIPSDGEGASHLISISVTGAPSNDDADRIARSIAQSALVKTAITGGDPNWGRIMSAAGYCGVDFDPQQAALHINGHPVYQQGEPAAFDSATVSQSIKQNFETEIRLSVGAGEGTSEHLTSDLTVQYVRFNSEYHT